ncbi:MAG: single-stranded DNA-binding protein [Verrucomicrobiae bacterium]|nr:single-stranded DNA-binding protein [Verrucomicrobiae bacterium]
MASYNKVLLIGNLTRDPELKYTPKGTAVARLGLAVNRRWRSETGEEKEEVTFVDIDAFGRQAEVLAQYLRKGRPLFVEGRLRLDTWEDKNTHQKRSQLRVVLEGFSFLDSAGGRTEAPANGNAAARPAPAAAPAAPPPPEDAPPLDDDDVPF